MPPPSIFFGSTGPLTPPQPNAVTAVTANQVKERSFRMASSSTHLPQKRRNPPGSVRPGATVTYRRACHFSVAGERERSVATREDRRVRRRVEAGRRREQGQREQRLPRPRRRVRAEQRQDHEQGARPSRRYPRPVSSRQRRRVSLPVPSSSSFGLRMNAAQSSACHVCVRMRSTRFGISSVLPRATALHSSSTWRRSAAGRCFLYQLASAQEF